MVYGECIQALCQFRIAVQTRTFQSVIGRPMCLFQAYKWNLKRAVPFLRQICMQITDKKSHLKWILCYIEVCIILHNLLTQRHDNGDESWIQDDFSDIDDADSGPLDDDNEPNLPVPDNARNDT